MAISKKIVIDNNKIDIITTNYNDKFIQNRNNTGRKKHDFELLSDDQFKKCLNQKIKKLSDYDKKCRTEFSLCWIEESDIDEDETIHLENGFDVVKTYKEGN